METNCKFEASSFATGYTVTYNCLAERQNFTVGNFTFTGVHKHNKSDRDVNSASLIKCTINKVPSTLTAFDQLERLKIDSCSLSSIANEDLKGFKNLKVLWLDHNLIEELPGDLFVGLSGLENVSLYMNKIKKIDLNLFAGIPNIRKFDLRFNKNFNLIFEADKGNNLEDFQEACEFSEKYSTKAEKGLIGDLKRFIHNHDFRDFTVTINDVEFDVHRFLLEARSPVLGEAIRNNPEVMSLSLDHEMSLDVFRVILDWIYEDKIPTEKDDLVGVYDGAKLWELGELLEHTREKLMRHLNADNAVKAFAVANKYNDENLKRAAFEEVRRTYPDLGFLNEEMLLKQNNLEEILTTEKNFDDEIHEDLKKIEELRKKVEKKQQEKAKWIGEKLFSN